MSLLEALIVVLLLCWLLGAFVVPTGGPVIHVLLAVVIVLVLVRLLRGQSL